MGVAAELGEGGDEVVDLILGEGEAEVLVGGDQRGASAREHRHGGHRPGRLVSEERGALVKRAEHRLRHPVVELGTEEGEGGGWHHVQRRLQGGIVPLQPVGDHALDAFYPGQAAEVGDISGLGGPRGNGAGPRGDHLQEPRRRARGAPGAVGEQFLQDRLFGGCQVGIRLDQVHKGGGEAPHRHPGGNQFLPEFLHSKVGEGGRAAENQHGRKRDVSQHQGRVKGTDAHPGGLFGC